MKCRNCNACSKDNWCYGVREPFKIKDIDQECTQYSKAFWVNVEDKNDDDISAAIKFFSEWIEKDLKDFDKDKIDYAKYISNNRKHISTALKVMEQSQKEKW